MNDINIPVKPYITFEGPIEKDNCVYFKMHWICPTCHYDMKKAPRCPECGQLIREEI